MKVAALSVLAFLVSISASADPQPKASLSDRVNACLTAVGEPARDLTGKTTDELEETISQVLEAKRTSIEDYFFVYGLLSAYDKKLRADGKTPNYTSQEFQDTFAKAIAERTSLLVDQNATNLLALSVRMSGKCMGLFESTDDLIREYAATTANRIKQPFKDKLSLRAKKRVEDEMVRALFQSLDSKKKPFPFDQIEKADLRIEGYLTALFTQERSDLEEAADTADSAGGTSGTGGETETHVEK